MSEKVRLSVAELLANSQKAQANTVEIPLAIVEHDGKRFYQVLLPAEVAESDLKVSSTGKSLYVTLRTNTRTKNPLMVRLADGKVISKDFRDFNINLTLA
jgi:HSP20 family molecular chaperone IbpA